MPRQETTIAMHNPRTYGCAPFSIAVIHGGPGAPGSMAPVARELSRLWGVLEPLQTADSLEGQLSELRSMLEEQCDLPVVLVGSSWGAMLGFIFTAHNPGLVRRLVLVGSGVFVESYATEIVDTRLSRLNAEDKREAQMLMEALDNAELRDKDAMMARLGELFTRADAYNPITLDTEVLAVQYRVYRNVWSQAKELRRSGKILELGSRIICPVTAIHGEYDPHPAEGIRKPLSTVLRDFQFILLEHCGHLPWIERDARDAFYQALTRIVESAGA